jgi:TPP-dependent pyruvate/acetoin dehydrogenase alpha subunit
MSVPEPRQPSGPQPQDAATVLRLYRAMLRIRRSEERILELLLKAKLSSTMCHVSIGQEAVAVGVCDVLQPVDYITSTHRGHGHFLARGGSLEALFAELMGREGGTCRGRGSSMHLVDTSIGHLGSNAIVGGHLPIATGAALWSKLSGQSRVTVCFFGDGASTEGVFHESVNLAAVQQLPIVFVVENNHYAMSLPWERSTAQPSFAIKAEGYGMAGDDVDGQDVLAVRVAAAQAVERARAGGGPTLLGIETYRFLGHSRGDPSTYRDPAEEQHWRDRDPLTVTQAQLQRAGVDTAGLDRLEAEITAELDEAVARAETSPPASLAEVYSDIYATPIGGSR